MGSSGTKHVTRRVERAPSSIVPLIPPLCLSELVQIHRYRDIRNALQNRLTALEYTFTTALLTKLWYSLVCMYLSFYVSGDWICNGIATSDSFHRFAHRAGTETDTENTSFYRILANRHDSDIDRTWNTTKKDNPRQQDVTLKISRDTWKNSSKDRIGKRFFA